METKQLLSLHNNEIPESCGKLLLTFKTKTTKHKEKKNAEEIILNSILMSPVCYHEFMTSLLDKLTAVFWNWRRGLQVELNNMSK